LSACDIWLEFDLDRNSNSEVEILPFFIHQILADASLQASGFPCFVMWSLSSWLERKRNLEGDREELVRRLEALDKDIVRAQAQYGAIYNKNSPILTLPAKVFA
jgi:hypothetical protein